MCIRDSYKVVSVIGDGALTGGMAFEALNNATRLEKNFIIVLNDNNMSISENVGGLSNHLNRLRTAESYHDLKEGVMNSCLLYTSTSTLSGIKKPAKPVSNVPEKDIQIPAFLKNTRK